MLSVRLSVCLSSNSQPILHLKSWNFEPLPKKYAFSSITWVHAIRIVHMRARLKGLSARSILILNLSQNSNIRHDLPFRNFTLPVNFNWNSTLHGLNGHDLLSLDQEFYTEQGQTHNFSTWQLKNNKKSCES
jgi:hypothetical protein